MFEFLTNWLVVSGYVSREDEEVVGYGLEQGAYSLAGLIIALLMSYIMNIFAQGIIFMAALVPLRMYAGGYHASTRLRCTVISFGLMLGSFLWMKYWNLSGAITFIIGIMEYLLLYSLIPVDGTYQLDQDEKRVYKKRGRMVLTVESVAFFGLWMVGYRWAAEAIAAVFSVVSLLAVWGMTKTAPTIKAK